MGRGGQGGAVTCRFLGDVEVDGSAGCFTVRCVRQHAQKELRRHRKNCGGEACRQPNCRAGPGRWWFMMVFAAGIHVRCQEDIGFTGICTSVPACAGNTIS